MNSADQLIQLVAAGDRQAFQQLYTLFADKVYNTAIGYVRNQEDAEEIAQDVFIRVFQNATRFKGESAVGTWIYRITVNTSLNLIKKKKRSPHVALDEAERDQIDFDHPGILLEHKEHARLLFQVIHTLPENQQTAFILSFVEHLPRQEVADIMALSLKAVESLLQRAKKKLREKLKNLYPNRRK